ncbi:SUMO-specific isopeptidase USPL1 [Betta splendens]|uniref:SUMO-specific isopeptidase USPL1 n=1 Tax=Betta splendens TaxID=158456 RepID=A0A6P7PA58_BETSP|nr:SUMO-specific isopeptidase USPL1 [Betta splendens]XP_029029096.1 SUMO-specific isopeptidase USPL1 [Betta splendens]
MVILCEWPWTAVDQKSSSGLPMTGEDNGLGSLASPQAGYLGKVQERCFSLEICPWCTSKGLNYALRSYRINLQESITLCTNPECLFPLVSRSLEHVLGSLNHVESTGNKRKKPLALEKEELLEPSVKRLRSDELDSLGAQSVADTVNHSAPHCAVKTVDNTCPSEKDEAKANGQLLNFVCLAATTTGVESSQDGDAAEPESRACTEDFPPPAHSAFAEHLQSSSKSLLNTDLDQLVFSPHCATFDTLEAEDDSRQVKSHSEVLNSLSSLTSNQSGQAAWTESLPADFTALKDTSPHITSEIKDLPRKILTQSEELVSVPHQIFWCNSNNLCWLDSLLIALVNCKNLKSKPKDEPQQSSVWQLITRYEDIYAAIRANQQTGRDGVPKVPKCVLQKANADLHNLRRSIFKLLESKLHCKLGQRETPVFAIPLLLKMDSWAEPLFQSTFHWEFKCSECNTATKERVVKTLPTFTSVVPEWHPLHAVHLAPCNACCKKNQRRTMILEKVPPVFVLHFVEGLPDNDVKIYTFGFKGRRYSITTVIQYKHDLKHFVTWVSNSDGSWLEYDDLKHPDCKTHQKLPVPAKEMHVVFWEVEPRACSPSSTCANSPPSKLQIRPSPCEADVEADELLTCCPDQSVAMSHNVSVSDIVCALTVSDDNSNIMDATVTAGVDVSIGSTTLLDTFEGLSHDDIITLTLISDSKGTQDLIIPNKNEILPAPDSSSTEIGHEMSQGPHVESATISNSSDPESVDNSSSDPTFVPRATRGRRRGKAASKPKNKRAALSKTAPPAPSDSSSVICSEPDAAIQHSMPPVEPTKPASPVSSTEAVPQSTSHISPAKEKGPDQNARWSFLLSKHPMKQFHKSSDPTHTTGASTQINLTSPGLSSSTLMHKQQTSGRLFPKPKLRMEESAGVMPKAAEMYVAFGAKSSTPQSSIPSAFSPTAMQPVTPHPQKSLVSTAFSSSTVTAPLQTSKVPPGLNKTEAVRKKLLKMLKAKKKALAKLDRMLVHTKETSLQPDSTNLSSPVTVTSSTYDGSTCDDFLSHLLSPATTASNLSPDSSGLQEILAGGQAVLEQSAFGVSAPVAGSQTDTFVNGPSYEFLDEFFSQAVTQTPTEMESEALSALDMFI